MKKKIQLLAVGTLMTVALCSCTKNVPSNNNPDGNTVTEDTEKQKEDYGQGIEVKTEDTKEDDTTEQNDDTAFDMTVTDDTEEPTSDEQKTDDTEEPTSDDTEEQAEDIFGLYFADSLRKADNVFIWGEADYVNTFDNREGGYGFTYEEWVYELVRPLTYGKIGFVDASNNTYHTTDGTTLTYEDIVQPVYYMSDDGEHLEDYPMGVGFTDYLGTLTKESKIALAQDMWKIAVELQDEQIWSDIDFFAEQLIEMFNVGRIYAELSEAEGTQVTDSDLEYCTDAIETGVKTVEDTNLMFCHFTYEIDGEQITYEEMYNLIKSGENFNYNQQGVYDFGTDIFLMVEYELRGSRARYNGYNSPTVYTIAENIVRGYIKDQKVAEKIISDIYNNYTSIDRDIMVDREPNN